MVIPMIRRPLGGNVRAYQPMEGEEEDLVVWWYGGIVKNDRAQSVPRVVVFFRRLDDQGVPGDFVRRQVALTHLGLLRIGTVWTKGVCRAAVGFQTEKVDVDFSPDSWRFTSPDECTRNGEADPINLYDYPLYFRRDKNWLIEFSFAGGKNLLIPCLEFLVRCYGRSEEVPRVLVTYPWEEVQRRFYAPFDQPALPEHWPIKLKKRMRDGDVVFLAHVHYDPHAQRAAKSVYAQVETAFSGGGSYAFVKITPWFTGPAQIKVSGLWINGGRTFLGLRMRGCSDPQGEPIQRDRENANKTDTPGEDGEADKARDGAPLHVLKKLPEIVDLTDDQEPDHGAATIEVEEPEFEILGTQRVVIDVKRDRAETSAGRPGDGGEPGAFSSGEAYGTG